MSTDRTKPPKDADWASTPSAMFAACVLGLASLLTMGLALSREYQRDAVTHRAEAIDEPTPAIDTNPASLTPPSVPRSGAVRLINIDTADLAELDLLPGIGPALGQRIIDHRNEHGPFPSIDALQQVRGIGPRTLEKLRPLVTHGQPEGYTSDN